MWGKGQGWGITYLPEKGDEGGGGLPYPAIRKFQNHQFWKKKKKTLVLTLGSRSKKGEKKKH